MAPPNPPAPELSHRARALIFNHSSVFDVGGPSDTSNYDPQRQRQIFREESDKAHMQFRPNLNMENAKDTRQMQNAGHGLVTGEGRSFFSRMITPDVMH